MNDIETTAVILSSLNYNDLQKMYNTNFYYLQFKNHSLLVDKLNHAIKLTNQIIDKTMTNKSRYYIQLHTNNLISKDIAQKIHKIKPCAYNNYNNENPITLIYVGYVSKHFSIRVMPSGSNFITYRNEFYDFLFSLIYDGKLTL